jgi:Lrp/AsnC family leucine-responsive transcriptional regulator
MWRGDDFASRNGIGDAIDSGAMAHLDETDRKLLALLQGNDRLPLIELSKEIGVAASTLNDRIKRLVRQGVITGFHARLSPEALGLDLLAFVFVGWSDPKVEPAFLERIAAAPAVLECHHVTGAWNYLLKVRIRTTRDLEAFLANTVKAVEGLQRTETVIVLSTAKETAALKV